MIEYSWRALWTSCGSKRCGRCEACKLLEDLKREWLRFNPLAAWYAPNLGPSVNYLPIREAFDLQRPKFERMHARMFTKHEETAKYRALLWDVIMEDNNDPSRTCRGRVYEVQGLPTNAVRFESDRYCEQRQRPGQQGRVVRSPLL